MGKKRAKTTRVKESPQLTPGKFKALIENTFDGIVLYDARGTIQYASQSVKKLLGYTPQDLIGKKRNEFVFKADARAARDEFNELLVKPGKRVTRTLRFIHKNGKIFWLECTLTNLLNNPDVNGIVANFRTVHEKKIASEDAAKSRQLLSTISDNIVDGIFLGIMGGAFQYVNRAFLQLSGYKTLEQLRNIKPFDLFVQPKRWNKISRQLKRNKSVRNEQALFKQKGGKNFWGAISLSVFRDNDNDYFVGSVQDITRQKEAEKQLHESQNFLDIVMRTVAAPIFVKDSKHRHVMFNDAFCWFTDLSRRELLGKTDYDFFSKEDCDIYWKIDSQVLRTGEVLLNHEKITLKDGKTKHMLTVKSRYINDEGEKFVIGFITDITEIRKHEEEINTLNANLMGVMESTQESIYAIDTKFRYIAFNKNHARMAKLIYGRAIQTNTSSIDYLKGTDEERWVTAELKRALKGENFVSEQKITQPRYRDKFIETTYNPIFDRKNVVTGVAVFVRDITQRKKSEAKLKILNDDLASQNWRLAAQEEDLKTTLEELSERNFELDQLMYKTSHDLRSPLSSILGLVNLANLDPEKENHLIYLNKIEGRIKKLDEFIRSMLNYARVNRGEIQFEVIDLKNLIHDCVRELDHLENFNSVTTRVIVNHENIIFKSDPLRMHIIIGNIISNAYKYYNPSVKSTLKIEASINAMFAEIMISDNGIGIKREHLKKIFDMFYRATEKSQGSGLGMYIVKQAIDKLKGNINVKSTFGKGTVIKIVVPNN
jgi:PAS domain S-box-containing protein